MRVACLLLSAVSAALCTAVLSTPIKCWSVKNKVIGAGSNIGAAQTAPDEGACCSLCQSTTGCKAWTFHPNEVNKACYLHRATDNVIHEDGVISGVTGPNPLPPPPPPTYTPPPLPPPTNYSTAEAACAAFDTNTKIELMHGFGWGSHSSSGPGINGYTRNSGCGNACGRPYFRWDNGPQGFDDSSPAGTSTQWPSSLNMGATWDPTLALEWGTAMGLEFWNKGTNIQEGPGVNIARIEKNGRTFEYLSGEDPILGSVLAPPLVNGIQKNVMAITKHYLLNNQETDRSGGNMIADEKTIMELYFPPFASVASTTAGYMCSYNRINGVYACENKDTLTTMLRNYANFTGFVVSDWGATHSTSPAINAGLDIEMPSESYFNQAAITAALAANNFSTDRLQESCIRIMSGWYKLPADRRYPCNGGVCIYNNVSTPANKLLARKLSAMSTVLLQNEGDLLPLAQSSGLKIAIIGNDADTPYTAGQGSGGVKNSNVAVSPLEAFQNHGIDVVYVPGNSTESAAKAAAAADIAIVFGSAHSGEGHDRANLLFEAPEGSDPTVEDIIQAVGKVQKKTIVVAAVPGQILTDWRTDVASILVPFLPGEQYGNAIFDVIFGEVTPQAKLPLTFPNVENEQRMTVAQYPGLNSTTWGPGTKEAHYSEGQIVGYRWYDKNNVKAAFAFGHGLTYGGGFAYSGLSISGRTISFTINGHGCDTPQIYIGYPNAESDPQVPVKVLRNFQKKCAVNHMTDTISYTLTDRDVSNWDVSEKAYVVTKGAYTVYVGSSSQDIRLTGKLTV